MLSDGKAFEQILELLCSKLGVDFRLYKAATLRRRMERRMAELKCKSVSAYLLHLKKNPNEFHVLFDKMLIQVTDFFRDAFVFEALKKKHLRRLVKEKGSEPIRLWVPACSTGEEVYSLAILCAELVAGKKDKPHIQIFATDINERVLEKARAGFYPDSARRHISAERLANFFDRVPGGIKIRKHIRELCVFARHDVSADPPFSNLDLISCRNLLIYMTPPLQHRLMPVFHYGLRPEGLLVLGSSETVGPFTELFSLENKRAKIYMKKKIVKSKGGAPVSGFALRRDKKPSATLSKASPVAIPAPPLPPPDIKALLAESVKDYVSGSDAAQVVPVIVPNSSEKIYMVLVDRNLDAPLGSTSAGSSKLPPKKEVLRLRQELSRTQKKLQAFVDDGDTTTEKLRAANEEIVSSNEELQSTNEELETAKEELQAANEELGALNSELESRNQELERSAAISHQFTALVESSEDAIISINLDGAVQTWNKGAEKIFGYGANEVVGKPITILISEEHIGEEPGILYKLRQGAKIDHYETVRRRKDGTMIDVSVTISPIRNTKGDIIGASKIARDVTGRKAAEAELKRTREMAEKALQAKDDFLAALSHELRTPLNPVLLLASDAAANRELPSSIRGSFELIRRNVETEVRLIDDLLDLTRIGSGKMTIQKQNVVVTDVLTNTIAMVRNELEQKQLTLIQNLDPTRAVVSGDPVRLQQIFWNILRNAVKFTAARGIIKIKTVVSPTQFKVMFSDTGIGMTKEELERAFDSFRRSASDHPHQRLGGLGLGLTISKQLVDLQGGTIAAQSEGRNFGSTFTVTFPVIALEEAKKSNQEDFSLSVPAVIESKRILLVEDHPPTREVLARLLTKRRHTVKAAGSISEALLHAATETFDIVITDLGLPDGNGSELFEKLIKEAPHLVGIALTGYGMEDDVERSKCAGFQAHLTKPVGIQILEEALARVTQSKA